MITMIASGVRNEYFGAHIGVGGEVVFSRKSVFDPHARWPYQVGHNGRLESFMSYDGVRRFIVDLVIAEFDRLNELELDQEVTEGLARFVEEISPPA